MQRAIRPILLVVAMALAQLALAAVKTPTPKPTATPTGKSAAEAVTVAVFDFDSIEPGLREAGRLVAEAVRARLAEGGLRVVPREATAKLLEEQKLAGVGDETAARLGGLLGARIIVTGRLFDTSGRMIITAKSIGVETGRVFNDVMHGERDRAGQLGRDLGGKVFVSIEKNAEAFVARIVLSDEQLAALRKVCDNGPRPRVYLVIAESADGRQRPDPAAQTQFGNILRRLGVDSARDQNGAMREWTNHYLAGGEHAAPPRIDTADIVIIGKGVSQPSTRAGRLVACRAGVELEAIDIKTGQTLASDRETCSATRATEALALQSAFEQAAARLAGRMLPTALTAWRAAQGEAKAK